MLKYVRYTWINIGLYIAYGHCALYWAVIEAEAGAFWEKNNAWVWL